MAFAFGPKTLAELEGSFNPSHLHPPEAAVPGPRLEAAADAYRRWQWAHHYRVLSGSGWSGSVYAMLGLPQPQAQPQTQAALAESSPAKAG